MTESCVACGCKITADKATAGEHAGLQHGGKWYCLECAAMILSPEELERLSHAEPAPQPKPTTPPPAAPVPAPARPPSSILASDDILGEDTEPPPNEPDAEVSQPTQAKNQGSGIRRKPATQVPEIQPSASGGSSSRRRGVSTSARRDSSVTGVRGEREKDNAPNRNEGRARKREADSMGLYIGLGVGAVALMLVLYFVFGRTPDKTAKAPGKPKEHELVDNDKTTSAEYERRAEDFQAKKEWQNSRNMYNKAIDKAISEKNEDRAKVLQMKLESMSKSSTLK